MGAALGPVVVIGIGNEHRGDDGAGLALARALRGRVPPQVTVLMGVPDAAALIEAWDGAALAILVDAASSGAPPGTVHRIEGADAAPPARPRGSTHGLGVAEAIALGRVLDRLPRRLVVFAIEGSAFEPGESLSPPVQQALETAVARILEEIAGA